MVNVLSFDKDSLSGCGFATFARSGGGSVVGLIIILLILGALLLVAYVLLRDDRTIVARPPPLVSSSERDVAEVGQAIAATSVLSARTERPPAESQSDWVGASQEPWRKLLANGVQDALDEDTGEMVTIHPQSSSDHVEGILVAFRYRDASDNPSRRMLLCWRCYEQYGALYVRGYCTLREALRTFRPDRMTS
jgi:hypothetical protein